MRPTPPFPNTQMGKAEECETTDQTKGRPGTPRNATEPGGTRNLAIPQWNPPYFAGFSPNYVIYFPPKTPIPQHTNGKGGCVRNYRPKKGRRGTTQFGYPDLGSATFRTVPSKFSNIFGAPRPFPNTQMGKEVRFETTDQNKASRRNTTLRRGTPRNPTEPDGAPKFGYSALESSIFWRSPSEFSNIFCAQHPPFPNTQMGKAGDCETTDHTRGRRGTPRNAAEPDGTPKFGYSALGSAKIWRTHSKFANIFCARRLPFPNTQMRKEAECETADPNKVARRNTAERYGTWRGA